MRKVLILLVLVILGFWVFYSQRKQNLVNNNPVPTVNCDKVSVIVSNLNVPWSLVFLPNGDLLFTQRGGDVMVLKKGQNTPIAIGRIEEAKEYGEGGLLGAAISPKFPSNHYIFFYYTYDSQKTLNRVVRYKMENDKLSDAKTIIDAVPGAIYHNGGRIKFGPDGYLYVTAGDSLNPSLAQDKNALAGKILRVSEDGNPEVYSYGHRNPQGLTWDNSGQLWETEHGNVAHDEINRIEKDKNYGWPTIQGSQTQTGMETPIINSENDTWAPSGLAYLDGNLYFAGLRGQALYKFNIATKALTPYFKNQFGRIRDVVVGPEGFLYIATNNRDGRGSPSADDDKIIRIDPEAFQ